MHWTGSYYNWNSRCAECHSTNLSKRFDPNSGTYATTWSEINVGCEACHGPGGRHLALADAGRLQDAPDAGLAVDLRDAGAWRFVPNATIARRSPAASGRQQVETCAPCHARRTSLGEYRHGADLLDTHLPALLEEGLYYADGQIREEVYVHGSFVQSRMYQAGVTCSNCHEPHGLRLRAPGNIVCAQCHLPAAYDNTTHHRHAANSPGAECANCHMPATTYMSVDPRRDHSLRIHDRISAPLPARRTPATPATKTGRPHGPQTPWRTGVSGSRMPSLTPRRSCGVPARVMRARRLACRPLQWTKALRNLARHGHCGTRSIPQPTVSRKRRDPADGRRRDAAAGSRASNRVPALAANACRCLNPFSETAPPAFGLNSRGRSPTYRSRVPSNPSLSRSKRCSTSTSNFCPATPICRNHYRSEGISLRPESCMG